MLSRAVSATARFDLSVSRGHGSRSCRPSSRAMNVAFQVYICQLPIEGSPSAEVNEVLNVTKQCLSDYSIVFNPAKKFVERRLRFTEPSQS